LDLVQDAPIRHPEIIDIGEQYQVPCGPVYRIDEKFEDPQYVARANILFFNDQRSRAQALPNVVPRLFETPGQVKSLGPALGAHNEEVYRDRLGLSETDLQRLRAAGVI